MTLQFSNNKKSLFGIFYILWLLLSFGYVYLKTSAGVIGWRFFFFAFLNYLIYFHVISIIFLAYLLTGGKFSEIKNNLKSIIVISSILMIFAFTLIRWNTLITSYGQYGNYLKYVPAAESMFYFEYGANTPFEKETIYREAVKYKYNLAFEQIWTFGAFIFASTFLILKVIENKTDK